MWVKIERSDGEKIQFFLVDYLYIYIYIFNVAFFLNFEMIEKMINILQNHYNYMSNYIYYCMQK